MIEYFEKLIAVYDKAIRQTRQALDEGVDNTTQGVLVNGILEQIKSKAYFEGYASFMIGHGGEARPCPYEEATSEYERWWDGFDDATEDYQDKIG